MIAVIFELISQEEGRAGYLDHAAALRPLLEEVSGFLGVERFESLSQPGKLLSLSFFEDEVAVARWRQTAEHRAAQEDGRAGLFAGYRLRVAEVLRDYGLEHRDEAPSDSRAHHT